METEDLPKNLNEYVARPKPAENPDFSPAELDDLEKELKPILGAADEVTTILQKMVGIYERFVHATAFARHQSPGVENSYTSGNLPIEEESETVDIEISDEKINALIDEGIKFLESHEEKTVKDILAEIEEYKPILPKLFRKIIMSRLFDRPTE